MINLPFKQNFYYQFVARSKYCFSLQFPHFSRLKKTLSQPSNRSFRFARIALAAQRALAARFEQDTSSGFPERNPWQRDASSLSFFFFFLYFTNAHILYQNLHSRLRSPILVGFKADYEGSSSSPPLSPLLGRATSVDLPSSSSSSSADFSYLSPNGWALVSLTADDIPTGSKAWRASVCIAKGPRLSPFPSPLSPPPRPFLSRCDFTPILLPLLSPFSSRSRLFRS